LTISEKRRRSTIGQLEGIHSASSIMPVNSDGKSRQSALGARFARIQIPQRQSSLNASWELQRNLEMSIGTILLILLILLLLGAIPSWPHSRNWGYGPSGGLGLIVVILIILVLMGRL
jgi:hypothetical protein